MLQDMEIATNNVKSITKQFDTKRPSNNQVIGLQSTKQSNDAQQC